LNGQGGLDSEHAVGPIFSSFHSCRLPSSYKKRIAWTKVGLAIEAGGMFGKYHFAPPFGFGARDSHQPLIPCFILPFAT